MSKTTITHPDGGQTVIHKQGCGSGCGTFVAVALVLALPASFSSPWNVIAYVIGGVVIALAVISAAVAQNRKAGAPPAPPPPDPRYPETYR